MLPDPEAFFLSRYSLREFEDEKVPHEVIVRAVGLANKTPSVCNRQAWKVYHTSDNEVRDIVLKYQSGNRPFGQHIPNLMVISVDLKAFFFGQEHYQHWIEGGLFSMSLIYALHSLGVASCPLNWSQTPNKDRQLRRLVGIEPHYTIIMALAVGYPRSANKVCVSARKPISEVLLELEKRR
jgi:nitroreductase